MFIGSNFLLCDLSRIPCDEDSMIEFVQAHFEIQVAESQTVVDNVGSIGGLTRFVLAKKGASQPVG